MFSRIRYFGALTAIAVIAACGGGGNASSNTATGSPVAAAPSPSSVASPSPNAAPTAAASGTAIEVATTRLGKVLVDSDGRTLYLFLADKGATSVCYGQCAAVWPPVLTTRAPQAGAGVIASLLGTTRRSDGTLEVTYSGHPLYLFISDTKPGDVTGQGVDGFGGPWYVIAPTGMRIG